MTSKFEEAFNRQQSRIITDACESCLERDVWFSEEDFIQAVQEELELDTLTDAQFKIIITYSRQNLVYS